MNGISRPVIPNCSWLNTVNSINNQITLCVFNSVQPVLFFFFFFTGLARGTRNGEPFLPSCVLEISPQKNRAWGPFLESPGNFSGPKSNIQIEI